MSYNHLINEKIDDATKALKRDGYYIHRQRPISVGAAIYQYIFRHPDGDKIKIITEKHLVTSVEPL